MNKWKWYSSYLVLEKSGVSRCRQIVDMPLFGKKNPASSGSKPAGPTPAATPEPAAKKTPTVEDKYILKDVLGTWVNLVPKVFVYKKNVSVAVFSTRI